MALPRTAGLRGHISEGVSAIWVLPEPGSRGRNMSMQCMSRTIGILAGALALAVGCTDGADPANGEGAENEGDHAIFVQDPSRTAFVHLFEWKWTDVARECETYLGPKGFTAVQISPPNEHNWVTSGDGAPYPWWMRYQPV